ncbi:family 43 glycosylhydrolase [Streptomyces sp. 6N223]|uniref:family 43 glycosylhydrolase n=1 Tax=Streptomyces sp. 6N223 TaxID=3457412 RepID=UPI003FD1BA87
MVGYVDPWGDNGDGTYTNPVLGSDYADPDAIRVGDDYWAVTSTFVDSPGVSVLHSRDLVNWRTVSAAFDDITLLGGSTTFNGFSDWGRDRYNWTGMSEYNEGVYAPSIKHNPLTRMFYIAVNTVTGGMFVASASDPAGQWDARILKDRHGRDLVTSLWTDPTLFFDEKYDASGRLVAIDTYFAASHVNGTSGDDRPDPMQPNVRGNVLFTVDDAVTTLTNADMSQYDLTYTNSSGDTVTLAGHGLLGGDLFGGRRAGPEGNKIYKRGDYYYLFYCDFQGLDNGLNEDGISGMGCYMLRSTSLYGTLPDGTPGSPGHVGRYEVRRLADDSVPLQGGFLDTPDGDWFFFAQMNDGTEGGSAGRQPHLLPVTWPPGGWPVIGGETDAAGLGTMVWTAPKPVVRDIERDASGNWTYPGTPTGRPRTYPVTSPQGSDEFASPTLDRRWLWNHQPRSGYWSLTERPGWMRLKAFGTAGGNASFFHAGNTLHQRHLRSDQTQVTTRLDISHMTGGQRAGLAHFNGGTCHNAIAVQNAGTIRRVIIEDDDIVTPVATVPDGVATVDLISRTDADQTVAYYYSLDGGMTFVRAVTKMALPRFGGYRGDRVGIYTYTYDNSHAGSGSDGGDGGDDGDGRPPGFVDADFFRYSASVPRVEGEAFLQTGELSFTSSGESEPVRLYRSDATGARHLVPAGRLRFTVTDPAVAAVVDGLVRPTGTGTTVITVHYEGRPYVMDIAANIRMEDGRGQ